MLLQTSSLKIFTSKTFESYEKHFFFWKSLQAFPNGRRNTNNATAIQLGLLLLNCQAVELSTQIFKTSLCIFKYPTKKSSHPKPVTPSATNAGNPHKITARYNADQTPPITEQNTANNNKIISLIYNEISQIQCYYADVLRTSYGVYTQIYRDLQ